MPTLQKPASSLLFCPSLISAQVQSQLPQGFAIRPLSLDDYEAGFLETLSHLTTVGELTLSQFQDRFFYLKAHAHEYFTIVIEDTSKGKIAAAGTLQVSPSIFKCLNCRRVLVSLNVNLYMQMVWQVGHIEDIVVNKNYRKLNFGLFIIQQLKHIGKETGCYKVILDCSEANVPFYQKCGFTRKEVEMAWYIEKAKL